VKGQANSEGSATNGYAACCSGTATHPVTPKRCFGHEEDFDTRLFQLQGVSGRRTAALPSNASKGNASWGCLAAGGGSP